MFKDYFLFSFSNLRSRRLRSWLTMIGIFIGIAAVVSLISLGEGLRVAITSQFGFLGSDVLSVQASGLDFAGPPGFGVVEPLSDELFEKIRKVNGVEAAFNRYIVSGTLESNDKQGIGISASMPLGDDREVFERMVNLRAEEGRLLRDEDNKKVVLGYNFLDRTTIGTEIHAGDKVSVSGEQFQVIGILEKKGSFIFDNVVLMNENDLVDLSGDDGTTDVIAVKVRDQDKVNQVKASIEQLLRKERDVDKGDENFIVESPQSILEGLNSTLFAVQLFVYIIAFVSLLVGGIGIMNTMYTSVLERTKEIGIMKSVGARNSAIFSLFFIESGLLGLAGGVVGVVFGLIGAYSLALVGKLALGSDLIRAEAGAGLLIGALLFSFLVGTIFGVLPALQASKLSPVEALRK